MLSTTKMTYQSVASQLMASYPSYYEKYTLQNMTGRVTDRTEYDPTNDSILRVLAESKSTRSRKNRKTRQSSVSSDTKLIVLEENIE